MPEGKGILTARGTISFDRNFPRFSPIESVVFLFCLRRNHGTMIRRIRTSQYLDRVYRDRFVSFQLLALREIKIGREISYFWNYFKANFTDLSVRIRVDSFVRFYFQFRSIKRIYLIFLNILIFNIKLIIIINMVIILQ